MSASEGVFSITNSRHETDSKKKLPANGVRFPFLRKKAHGRHSGFPSGWIPSWKKQKESPIGHELLEGSQEKPAS